eukprot:4068724-Prymnesium_polylepis.1
MCIRDSPWAARPSSRRRTKSSPANWSPTGGSREANWSPMGGLRYACALPGRRRRRPSRPPTQHYFAKRTSSSRSVFVIPRM